MCTVTSNRVDLVDDTDRSCLAVALDEALLKSVLDSFCKNCTEVNINERKCEVTDCLRKQYISCELISIDVNASDSSLKETVDSVKDAGPYSCTGVRSCDPLLNVCRCHVNELENVRSLLNVCECSVDDRCRDDVALVGNCDRGCSNSLIELLLIC